MSSNDSNSRSKDIIRKGVVVVDKVFHKNMDKDHIERIVIKLNYPFRKICHFTEYFILGLLVISLISEYIMISRKAIIIGIIICLLYAVSDELHQLFTSGRSARVFDVLVDTSGSTVAIFIYTFIKNIFLRRKKYE